MASIVETRELTNTDWVRIEHQDDKGGVVDAQNFIGAVRLFVVDGGPDGSGVEYQAVDKDGVATRKKFKPRDGAPRPTIDTLVEKYKLTDPTKPAGVSVSSPSVATGQQQNQQQPTK